MSLKAMRKLAGWDADKNQHPISERSISFEEVIAAIEEGAVLDILPHPNPAKYPNHKIFEVKLDAEEQELSDAIDQAIEHGEFRLSF